MISSGESMPCSSTGRRSGCGPSPFRSSPKPCEGCRNATLDRSRPIRNPFRQDRDPQVNQLRNGVNFVSRRHNLPRHGRCGLGEPMMHRIFRRAAVACAVIMASASGAWAQTPLINETFEDASFGSRGWYDGTGGALSTVEKFGGLRSFECRFAPGATQCSGGRPGRHLFADTESVYFSYYIKHSTNWIGSGRSYHPHMFLFMTNL